MRFCFDLFGGGADSTIGHPELQARPLHAAPCVVADSARERPRTHRRSPVRCARTTPALRSRRCS